MKINFIGGVKAVSNTIAFVNGPEIKTKRTFNKLKLIYQRLNSFYQNKLLLASIIVIVEKLFHEY